MNARVRTAATAAPSRRTIPTARRPPSPFAPTHARDPSVSARSPRGSTGLATAALVCGIVGLFVFFLLVVSVVALVLGLVAASRAKQAPGPSSWLGRARAGRS